MKALLPFVAGLGLVLVYSGITAPPARGNGGMFSRLDRLIEEAGLGRFSAIRLMSLSAVVFGVSFVLLAGLTRSVVIAAFLAGMAAWSPISYVRVRRNSRLSRFREAWPDALATLIAAVRSGVSLPEACIALTERGPSELAFGFEIFASAYRATGSFSSAMTRMRDEFADPIADRVAVALLLARDVGGTDLVRVLRALGDFVREDLRVRKEVQARWSWTVTAARVASAAPWIVLLLMSTRAEAASAYNSGAGVLVIAGGAGATLLGYRLMLRAGRLPEERRLPQ